MRIQPVTLQGHSVRLEPLEEKHIPELALVGLDSNIWTYTVYGNIHTKAQLRAWVLEILGRQQNGTDLPFAVIHLESNRAVGATRYMNIQVENRSLEIGGTWYGVAYRRSTPKASTCYCGTPSKLWVVCGYSLKPTVVTCARSVPSNA
jgi:RimJ/RimL family protein N-acetyltransferase